jgi:hypothetical protein
VRDADRLAMAFRDGDDLARLVWADALEEAGDREGALAVRTLPALRDRLEQVVTTLREELVLRKPRLEVHLSCYGDWSAGVPGLSSWKPSETSGTSKTVRVLVSRWNDFHPALEWLARHLELSVVELNFSRRPAHIDRSQQGPFSLRRRHLLPLPGFVVCDCLLRTPRT